MAMQVKNQGARAGLPAQKALPMFSRKEFLDTFMVLPKGRFKTSDAGLKVAVLKEGKGDALKPGMTVKVHYTGWLETGKKFDSSVGKKSPFEFTLGSGQVIKGWEKGLAGIRPGERRQLIIPPNLAYGNRRSGKIPPGATLIFNVEAIEVSQAVGNAKGKLSITA